MRNFVPYLLLIFLLWIVMAGRLPFYLALVSTTRWNVTIQGLFKGVFGGGTTTASASGSSGSQALSTVGEVASIAAIALA